MSEPSPKPVVDYATPGATPRATSPRQPTQVKAPASQLVLSWVLFLGLALLLVVFVRWLNSGGTEVPFSTFVSGLESGKVRDLTVEDDVIRGEFAAPQTGSAGRPVTAFRVNLPKGGGATILPWLIDHKNLVSEVRTGSSSGVGEFFVGLLPPFLLILFVWFFVFRQLRRAGQAAQTAPSKPIPVIVVNPSGEKTSGAATA